MTQVDCGTARQHANPSTHREISKQTQWKMKKWLANIPLCLICDETLCVFFHLIFNSNEGQQEVKKEGHCSSRSPSGRVQNRTSNVIPGCYCCGDLLLLSLIWPLAQESSGSLFSFAFSFLTKDQRGKQEMQQWNTFYNLPHTHTHTFPALCAWRCVVIMYLVFRTGDVQWETQQLGKSITQSLSKLSDWSHLNQQSAQHWNREFFV